MDRKIVLNIRPSGRIGTAGWSIPHEFETSFPQEGSQLERYSQVFNCVEINSTFNKIHMPKTFEKWAEHTPVNFEFSLKLHRKFTHESDLKPGALDLKNNIRLMSHLGEKWTVLLLQFPGKQQFDEKKMARFFEIIRKNYDGAIVIEPRNLTWISASSRKLMKEFKVSKVQADPERCPHKTKDILSSGGLTYTRLHGSPEIYRSSYDLSFIRKLCLDKSAWTIFDNTMFGKATGNALELKRHFTRMR